MILAIRPLLSNLDTFTNYLYTICNFLCSVAHFLIYDGSLHILSYVGRYHNQVHVFLVKSYLLSDKELMNTCA